jgi:hypothetical protein
MTAAVPCLDALFDEPGVVVVPGLLRGLGITTAPQDAESGEPYEEYLLGLSRDTAS